MSLDMQKLQNKVLEEQCRILRAENARIKDELNNYKEKNMRLEQRIIEIEEDRRHLWEKLDKLQGGSMDKPKIKKDFSRKELDEAWRYHP